MSSVRLLHDEKAIARRVEELAAAIADTCPRDFIIIGVLKGCFIFVADLVRELDRGGRTPLVDFMRLSSYGRKRESSGDVRLVGPLPEGIEGQTVLLVDDILDTGLSLATARELLAAAGAKEIHTCVLVDKPSRRAIDIAADFTGFTVDNGFIVGYGIDFSESHRHLPYLGVIE